MGKWACIFICILHINSIDNLIGQNAQNIYQDLHDPVQIFALSETMLIVEEYAGPNSIKLIWFDKEANEPKMIASIPFGNGPGELSNRQKVISAFNDTTIFIWDSGRQAGNFYDLNLKFRKSITFGGAGYVYKAVTAASKTIMVFSNTDNFASVWKLDDDLSPKRIKEISLEENGEFTVFQNPLLKQAINLSNAGNTTCFSFEFSSLVGCLQNDTVSFLTGNPHNFRLGEKFFKTSARSMPDVAETELVNLDIDLTGGFLYVLHKGEKVVQRVSRDNVASILNGITHSDQLLVYSVEKGGYIKAISLEEVSKKIEFFGEVMFTLSTINEPVIKRYSFKKLMAD